MTAHSAQIHERYMCRALELAELAAASGEVPVGALIVVEQSVVGVGRNSPIRDNDPTAHAEIIALRAAAAHGGNYRIPGATLYVTLEPCQMCAGAMIHARIEHLVYAAADPRTGAAGSAIDILGAAHNNHRPTVTGGVLAAASAALLQEFFTARRSA
ncbi:MAG: tRNA adenosine(34) deaminase TadA [Gammaproteobacteria bacterium]|nr:tRNA adenosine(34) deaminase TadA [Gammaproteobacteria bacterium]